MPFEQVRKKLMSQNADWGAPPPTHGHIPSVTLPPKSGTITLVEPTTTTAGMDHVVAERPRSKTFVSSKGWTVDTLVGRGPRFQKVPRVSARSPRLFSKIKEHERSGIPLIIQGWHKHGKWPKEMFTVDWFREHGQQDAKARNVHDWTDRDISIHDLIAKQRALSPSIAPGETERLYGKDAHCPEEWTKWLKESDIIPSRLRPEGSNDLLQCVPEAERVETLMCYLGIGDTFTPCHKDLCASSGQNIMCYTEKSGSSFWFMTEGSSAPAAADYFHKLGTELDLETHVITVDELEKAPFKVYIAEQKLGDMVLVPPRSCHQVVNHGGITIKMSWSRMTLDGLATAFYHELPIYRRVCRTETYRVKYTIYHALLFNTQELLKYVPPTPPSSPHDSRLPMSSSRDEPLPLSPSELKKKEFGMKKLRKLITLFDDVLVEEFSKDHNQMSHMTTSFTSTASSTSLSESSDGSTSPTPDGISRITCDFCDTDVFQSFFECRKCIPAPPLDAMDTGTAPQGCEDGLVICPSCYVEGRTCQCEVMRPVQCRPFSDLLRDRNLAVKILEQLKDQTDIHPVLHEGNILSGRLSIFEAACTLYRYYENLHQARPHQLSRVCARPREPHSVSRNSLLYCKKCHCSACFDHILQLGVHSAEAILVHQADSSHVRWHDRHKDTSLFDQARPQIIEAEKDGSRCDITHKLVLTATNFNAYMPTNSTFTKPGWYDKVMPTSNIPTEDSDKHATEETAADAVGYGIPGSPLSELSSLPASPSLPNSTLPNDGEENPSNSDVEEHAPLSMGNQDQVHLSVRPTGMAVNPPSNNFVESSVNCQRDSSTANLLADSLIQKKRKRQVLDHILMPQLPYKAVRWSIPRSKRTRKSSTSQAKAKAKQMETDRSVPADRTTPSHSIPGVDASPPSVRPTRSLRKRTSSKASSKRTVVLSRPTTPDIVSPAVTRSVSNEEGPPKKRARFRQVSPELPDVGPAASSAPTSQKRKADTQTVVSPPIGEQSGAASTALPSTPTANVLDMVQRTDRLYSHGHSNRVQPFVEGSSADVLPRSSAAAGPSSLALNLSSPNISEPVVNSPRSIRMRSLERKLEASEKRMELFEEQRLDREKQISLLVKKNKAQERRIHKLEEQVNSVMDQQQRCSSRQEDHNATLRKIQHDISSGRDDSKQQIGRTEQRISDIRTDIGELRTRITENAQTSISSPTSTHIVLIKPDAIHNNRGQQFGYNSRGTSYNWNNSSQNRQFHVQADNFEGRQFSPRPSRFSREDGGRGNNTGWYPPKHKYQQWNGNKHSFDHHDRRPIDQMAQHQGGPTAGPSRPPHGGYQSPGGLSNGKKRRWGPPRNHPNTGAEVVPAVASRDSGADVDGEQTPQRSVLPAGASTIQDQVRSRSPSFHWEDNYEHDEETAPVVRLRDNQTQMQSANEQLASASGLTGTIVMEDPAEENPWAT